MHPNVNQYKPIQTSCTCGCSAPCNADHHQTLTNIQRCLSRPPAHLVPELLQLLRSRGPAPCNVGRAGGSGHRLPYRSHITPRCTAGCSGKEQYHVAHSSTSTTVFQCRKCMSCGGVLRCRLNSRNPYRFSILARLRFQTWASAVVLRPPELMREAASEVCLLPQRFTASARPCTLHQMGQKHRASMRYLCNGHTYPA